METTKRLGELLVDLGHLTQEQLEAALQAQKKGGKRLGETIVELGFISEQELLWALSHKFDLPLVSVDPAAIPAELVELLPYDFVRDHSVLPIFLDGNRLTVVIDDPVADEVIADVERLTGYEVDRALAPAGVIRQAIDELYENQRSRRHDQAVEAVSQVDTRSGWHHAVEGQRVLQPLVEELLAGTSSRMRIEPEDRGLVVRSGGTTLRRMTWADLDVTGLLSLGGGGDRPFLLHILLANDRAAVLRGVTVPTLLGPAFEFQLLREASAAGEVAPALAADDRQHLASLLSEPGLVIFGCRRRQRRRAMALHLWSHVPQRDGWRVAVEEAAWTRLEGTHQIDLEVEGLSVQAALDRLPQQVDALLIDGADPTEALGVVQLRRLLERAQGGATVVVASEEVAAHRIVGALVEALSPRPDLAASWSALLTEIHVPLLDEADREEVEAPALLRSRGVERVYDRTSAARPSRERVVGGLVRASMGIHRALQRGASPREVLGIARSEGQPTMDSRLVELLETGQMALSDYRALLPAS